MKERPFACTQIVIRNPSINSFDHNVCVRTRPRASSYNLCPLFHGQLIEVVAFAESTEGDVGVVYFRQRMGGWINSQHVVCVFPSEASISNLVQMHFAARSKLPLGSSVETNLALMKESIDMINEDASYGSVSAYFTLLPLHAAHDRRDTPESHEILRETVTFVDFLLRFACNELARMCETFSRADTSTAFVVRLAARCLAVVNQLIGHPQQSVPRETVDRCVEAAQHLIYLLSNMFRAPLAPQDTPVNVAMLEHTRESVDIWTGVLRDSVTTESSDCATILVLRDAIATAAAFCGSSLSMDHIKMLRMTVNVSLNVFGPLFCSVISDWIPANRPDRQAAAVDLDSVEVAIAILKRGGPSDNLVLAVDLISAVVRRNPLAIQMLASVCIPALATKLKGTIPGDLLLSVVNCCTEFAYNSSQLIHAEQSGCYCTAALYQNCAPFQPMNAFRTRVGVVAVCDYCSVAHPPTDSIALESEGRTSAYFTCRCTECRSLKPDRCLPPPDIPLTFAQRLLGENRVLQSATQQLRCWDDAVNAVGRLSMRLECTEELGVALFCALVNRRSLSECGDGALAVSACQNLTLVQEFKRKFPDAAITRYLDAHVPCASISRTPSDAHDFRATNTFGLTPSPGSSRGEHSATAVELFGQ